MNRMLSGAARAAAALAAAGGAALLAAAPAAASAAPPVNQAYALQANGHVSVQQAGTATDSGGSPVVLPNVDAAGLVSTGVVTDRAGPASASSQLPAVTVTLPGHAVLRARAVSSACRSGGPAPAVTGSTRITGGEVTAGRRVFRLPATAAPNTRIVIPGAAVILVNRQFTGAAGTLTVAALRIRMLRGHQRVLLATSVCTAASLAPAPAGNARVTRLAIGLLGLLLLGGIARALSRRHRPAAAPGSPGPGPASPGPGPGPESTSPLTARHRPPAHHG